VRITEVRITVSGWVGDDLRLEAPVPVLGKAHERNGTQHVWTLQFPPGLPQTVTLSVNGRLPAARAGETWTMPRVRVDPFSLQDHWIGLFGVEVAGKEGLGLRPVPPLPTDCPAATHELRAGTRVGALDHLRGDVVLRNPSAVATTAAHILRAEQDTFWGGMGWIHQLDVLAFSHGQGELRVRLPDTARARAIAIDDQVATPADGELLIPLAGTPGPRHIQICWTFADGESPAAPRQERAIIRGDEGRAIDACFWLPAAYQRPVLSADVAERNVESLLRQAEAQMQVCALWAASAPSPEAMARAQQAFQGYLEHAGVAIALLNRSGEASIAAELAQRVKRLVQENGRLAKEGGYAAAGPQTRIAFLPSAPIATGGDGLPVGVRDTDVLPLPLAAVQQDAEAVARSGMLLLGLTAISLLVLSYFRRGLWFLGAVWPELLLGLALLGAWLDGISLIGVGILIGAVALRSVWLVLMLRRAISGWLTNSAAPTNGDRGPIPSPPPAS
jgi:hypothetical protein